MSQEINKPAEPTYWRAYGPDGTIHEGVTEPNQVTTTGQPDFVFSADPADYAGMVAASGSTVQPMPPPPVGTALGEAVIRGHVYDFNGTVYICVQDHNRMQFPPDQTPALWTPARVQAEPWVQPTGAQDAYAVGDRVTHDRPADGGAIWLFESKIPANTTEPGRDGTFDRWWEPVEAV